MLDDEFRTVIKNETRAYSDRICDAVRQHIDRKRAETEMAAATRDRTDLDRAKEIADKQLARRLGCRLEETKRRQLLDQAGDWFRPSPATDRERWIPDSGQQEAAGHSESSNAGKPSKKRKVESSSVSILNRFSVLQSHDDDDDEIAREEVEPIDQDDEGAEATVAVHTVTANTVDRSDDASDAMILGDNSATAVASYLTAAKTGVQTETTEKQVAVAGADTETVVVAEVHGKTLARGRSVSLERPRTPRPSTQTMRTGNGVVVHTGTDKEKWRIVPEESTKVLVIGESNVKRFSSTPRGWEVHCLPGAKLHHVNRVLEDVLIQESKSLSVVYVQVGINHRTEDPERYKRQEWSG